MEEEGGRVGLGRFSASEEQIQNTAQRLERQRPRRLKKAWEAGPRWEVPARGVAAHRCDDLPGPGHQGAGQVLSSVPLSRALSGRGWSCQFSQESRPAVWALQDFHGLWCGARRVPLGWRLLSRAAHGSEGPLSGLRASLLARATPLVTLAVHAT